MILITNPTGRIGRIVINRLLESGITLRILARDVNKLPSTARQHTELVTGSHSDTASLQKALAGVDAVFWCVPQHHQAEDMLAYYTDFARPFASLLKASGVKRVVGVSSGGKGLAKKNGPIAALHAVEDMINISNVATRFLRCGNFMENFLWQVEPMKKFGKIGYPMRGDKRMPMVAVQDIAEKAVYWLSRSDWTGQHGVGVHGPADLSFEEAAAVLSEATSKPITFEQMPDETYAAILRKSGSSRAFAQALVDMFHEVEHGIYDAEPRSVETTTPTTLLNWAQENLTLSEK